ncbi:ribosomal RNA small subunit methyltransferase A [Synergistales bacterium]|nr:ribosomal RNA small subunit methyltransferase A [Synergistales bacterium]
MNSGVAAGDDFFRTKKRFGQNFLVDRSVLADILKRADVRQSDVILEIGPGEGVLTRELLLARPSLLYAVELDVRLKDALLKLKEEFSDKLNLLWGDAVKLDYSALSPFPTRVVANIPYNITTPLIWRLLEYAPLGLTSHIYMVQKEAALRLTARPDTKDRYPLGVALEVMGTVSLVRAVAPSCFRPRPRVESAVIEICLSRNLRLLNDGRFSALLHASFRQRRKMLVNNLKNFSGITRWESVLEEADIEPKIRAEDLGGEEWLKLYGAWTSSVISPPPASL